MPNIFDYLAWRGDLSFECLPFGEIDAFVLSRLAYVRFDGIVPAGFNGRINLFDAAKRCLAATEKKNGKHDLENERDAKLLREIMQSHRYSTLYVCGYVNYYDITAEEQFAALTFIIGDSGICVSYRGTDNTIVGWKEDFNMSFQSGVPAQLDAVKYLNSAAAGTDAEIYLCGHSKGGNLAVYAGGFCKSEYQNRIVGIYNLDGPGFLRDTIDSEGYKNIVAKIHTFIPQSSVVGLLLEHGSDYTVVSSTNVGLMQHELYSWEIMRSGFVRVDEITRSSKFIDSTLEEWLLNMDNDLRRKFIDGVFEILSVSNARTISELFKGGNPVQIIKALATLEPETGKLISEAFDILKASAKKNLPAVLDSYFDKTPKLAKKNEG